MAGHREVAKVTGTLQRVQGKDKTKYQLLVELAELRHRIAELEAIEAEGKRAEEGMERAAREWRTTFDAISDWISIHDENFKITRMNRAFAKVFKKEPKELIGKTCYELVHGTKEPWPDCPHQRALKVKHPTRQEFVNPHLGIYMEVVCSPIFNDRGEVTATVHIVRDITERKKMEEQLVVTDRLASIGELASGVAHELNNPLTGIIGYSELLLDEDIPDNVRKDLRVIQREAQRSAGIVRNLLTFARKHAPSKGPVDINSIIQKALELRAYELKVNNIQVNTYLASDLPEIMADGFQLEQVFINIIINAEYFMIEAHGRGTLTITTEQVGNTIRASFTDDGPGIAKKNLGHLFDPFFTTKEVGKGTGLGLSISYGIISEHSGRIYAESELGKGATFAVELPTLGSNREP
jgi:PAS domain S-box-containing protein